MKSLGSYGRAKRPLFTVLKNKEKGSPTLDFDDWECQGGGPYFPGLKALMRAGNNLL